jgi:hypothetical protein
LLAGRSSEEKHNVNIMSGATVMQEKIPSTIKTTLYDLMIAMQDEIDPGEEGLVVVSVMRLLRSGRITFLRAPGELDCVESEPECVSHP